ncbi:inner centromere protein [Hoplias malabaricus]|uniref:inner centromere protein n=1 Tax=Hoplias malabaricus TaxID=27720 RepID=UPI00346242D9
MVEERKEAEESTEVDKEEVSEGAETREADMFLEKQGSLITLAWSIPTDSMTKDQEMSASLAEKDASEISRNSPTQISTQQVHAECLISHNEEQSHINPEDRDFAQLQSQEQKHSEHPGHSLTTKEHAFFQTPQDPASSTDAECEGSGVDGHNTHYSASEWNPENTHCTPQTHTPEKAETEAFSETQERESEDACEEVCVDVCEEQQLQREATMRSLVHIQRRAERRWQRDRDRQLLRVQERLAIVQNRKSDEDLLGLTQEDAFRHLTTSLQQEDEEHQKILVREKLQQLRRERSYILQSRRERNTAGFKELLAPTAQHMTNTEDGL